MAKFRVTLKDSGDRIAASFSSADDLSASFGEAQVIQSGGVLSDTTEGWNRQIDLVSRLNTVYVYTDHQTVTDEEGNVSCIPGVKIGDGKAYLIDLPFTDAAFEEHMEDTSIHVTQEEKAFWNNKNRGYVSEGSPETLVLTTD